MQQTVTVHGHFKTIDGKVIWVPEHQRHVEVGLDDDFAALVQEHGVKPILSPAPKKAAEPAPAPAKPVAEVPFADLKPGQIIDKPSTGGKWLIVSHEKAGMMVHPLHEENLDGKAPVDFPVTVSEWTHHMGVNAKVVDPKPAGPSSLDDDFAAFVAESGAKPIKAGQPQHQEPKAPIPQPETTNWTPDKGGVKFLWIGHNTEPGHNKVYKLAMAQAPDGKWVVVGQYGKTGGALSQVVHLFPSEDAAWKGANQLKAAKLKKGYGGANSTVWAETEAHPWAPIKVGATASKNARTGPSGKAPEAMTPPPAPAAPQGAPAITQKTSAGVVIPYKDASGGAWGMYWMMSGLKPELRITIPGGDLSKLTQEHLQAFQKLGATWMPNGHKFAVVLPGKPWAGGKGKAQEAHDTLAALGIHTTLGEPPKAQAAAPGTITAAGLANTILFDVKPTMTTVLANGVKVGVGTIQTTGKRTIRVYLSSISLDQAQSLKNKGFKQSKEYLWHGVQPQSHKLWDEVASVLNGPGPKVGDMKLEGGKTYQFNANHRWELVEAPKAQAKPAVAVPAGFPFKQVGPQKGSNPGGLYEDAAGKKWYIKFPESEDHAKNELLASRLYHALGIAVPPVRLVEKGGKVGIASKFMEGLKADPDGLAAAPGAQDGFGADAWLGNWDAVGEGFDNMLVGPDGTAYRIDPGGALIFRAQGAPKGDAFGEQVTETKTLMDAGMNPNTAKVYGGMTKAQKDASVAKVLEMPDEVITEAVMKFGPGNEEAKKALAAKLIARKKDLADQFPAANLIANPPKPDPTKLPVEANTFPNIPDFINWNGPGKGLSSNNQINEQNQAAAAKIYATATAGNLVELKAMTVTPVGGKPTHISNHPSTHITKMYAQCVGTLEEIANPASKQAAAWSFGDYGSSLEEVAELFPAYHYGVTKTNIDQKKRVGYWLHIGKAEGIEEIVPQNTHFVTDKESKAASLANKTMPAIVRQFMESVKDSGSANDPYREGRELDYDGNKCRDVIALAYQHAVPFEEGAIILRQQSETPEDKGMIQKLLAMAPGDMLQNPGSMCCSKKPGWAWGGAMDLEIIMAKGAKGLYNIGVGGHNSEQEITTLPGQRFMLLEHKEKGPKGTPWFRLLALPPDPAYIENLKSPKKGKAA